ncbi:MAG TPA: BON domain-containing protein [Rudaea sp.]|nr:BON domain-containing protein [Rudaea sp.]
MIARKPFTSIAATLALACASAGTQARATNDDGITAQVRDAIFHRAELAGDDISVQTHDGVVYLHGLVDTNVERDLAESIARNTAGVRRIVDSLELRNDYR